MLPSGTRLGPYEVLGLIGEGGMGQVYRAADTRLDRAVAIKVMPAALADDPIRRERFEREARSISRLEHPNICPLYDVGELPPEVGGGLFLVMQFLEGESLAERLARGALSIKETLDVGIQIAEALAAAHRAGIVHRDLKPGNVMLTRAGARLLDFGLARTVDTVSPNGETSAGAADRTALTTQGTLLGTLHYMAPEQLDGRDVDTRADIFAFGAVMYETVTGLKAFEAESPARVLSAILRDEPARVSTLVPVTPAGLDELIHTCLAKDPNERWQGMGDVARQLRWLLSRLEQRQVRIDGQACSGRAGARVSMVAGRGRGDGRSRGRRGADARPRITGRDRGVATACVSPAARRQLPDRRPGAFARRTHAGVCRHRRQRRTAAVDRGSSIRRARSHSMAPTAPAIRSGRHQVRNWRSSPTTN